MSTGYQQMLHKFRQSLLRTVKPTVKGVVSVSALTAGTVTAVSTARYVIRQKRVEIKGNSEFSDHTRKEHEKHLISGMHAPFITENKELKELFLRYFSEYAHLLPESADKLAGQHALDTSVQIKSLKELKDSKAVSDLKIPSNFDDCPLVMVGGAPALMSAVASVEAEQAGAKVIYVNDERRFPIEYGSAWHIEEDGPAEAPTTYKPTTFLGVQGKRAFSSGEDLEAIQLTGFFPWRTLDWTGNIKHPLQWGAAFRVASYFQLRAWRTEAEKAAEMNKIISQCKWNEIFYNYLNQKLDGKLLLPGKGAIIVARNKQEVDDLHAQQKDLAKEGRPFYFLSKEEMLKRYGFVLEGLAYAEKPHDTVLSPKYRKLLSSYIQQKGGKIINGTLTTIYTDGVNEGGVAEYQKDGQKTFLPCKKIVMSLGNQQIRDINNKPLFDAISATGSSGLALVYTPTDYKLPRVSVCGGTNNLTVLSAEPIPVMHKGESKHLWLVRMTAGACITPLHRGKEGGYYDSTISLGLLSAVRNTLGLGCEIEMLTMYGCNRVVSKNGQISKLMPYPGMHVYFGAGGGGLTRAPNDTADFLPPAKVKELLWANSMGAGSKGVAVSTAALTAMTTKPREGTMVVNVEGEGVDSSTKVRPK